MKGAVKLDVVRINGCWRWQAKRTSKSQNFIILEFKTALFFGQRLTLNVDHCTFPWSTAGCAFHHALFTFIFTIERVSEWSTTKMNLNFCSVSPKEIFYPSKLCNFIHLGFCKMNEEWKKINHLFGSRRKGSGQLSCFEKVGVKKKEW